MQSDRRNVDVRYVAQTTLVVVLVVMASVGAVMALDRLWRVATYFLVALFAAVVLTPAVDLLQHRAGIRRGVATLLVFTLGVVLLSGLIYSFVKPLVDQGAQFSDSLPTMVEDAQKGQGPVGDLVERYKLQDWVDEHQQEINDQFNAAGLSPSSAPCSPASLPA